MKLKAQIEKQRAYALRKRNEARKSGDTKMEWYWFGVYQSMDWAPGSGDALKYVDGEEMPKDEKFEW